MRSAKWFVWTILSVIVWGDTAFGGTFPTGDYLTCVSANGDVFAGVMVNSAGNISEAIVRDEVFYSSSISVDTTDRSFSAERGSFESGNWFEISGSLAIVNYAQGGSSVHDYQFAFDAYVTDIDNAAGRFISESITLLGDVYAPFALDGTYEAGQRLTSLDVGPNGQDIDITVPNPNNLEWSIASDAPWAVVAKTDGSSIGQFVLSLQENNTGEVRLCTLRLVSYGVQQRIELAQKPIFTVTFELDGKGERIGGGELTQSVLHGSSAQAPIIEAHEGWVFTGWDGDLGSVTHDKIFRALYRELDVGDVLPFNPNADWRLHALAVQADEKILIGGYFSSVGGVTRNRIARLNPDGSLDTGFNPNANFEVNALAVQADGKILIGGRFTSIGGVMRNRIARLDSDGALDSGFNPSVDIYTVETLAVQADGRILVGGTFTSIGGQTRNRLARLHSDGTLDTDFDPNANDEVNALAVQADGKILIGGDFTSIGGVTRNRIARLNSDGTLDSGFNPNANAWVRTLIVQSDGKILVGGRFNSVGGVRRKGLARLNPDGTPDSAFEPDVLGGSYWTYVFTVVLQADGRVLVGGDFTSVESVTRNYIARLNPDGTLDSGFNPNANSSVYALALQSDGEILVGGDFTSVGGLTRNRMARLHNNEAANQLVVSESNRIEWRCGGSFPEAERMMFDLSTDNGDNWAPLGPGARIPGGWELADLDLPDSGLIRAQAIISNGGISSGIIEARAILASSPFMVRFELGEHGARTGGGALVQSVPPGSAAVEPVFDIASGWRFDGWDSAFDVIVGDLTVTALYSPQPTGFADWFSGRGLAGDPTAMFGQINPSTSRPYGFEYAYGTNLPAGPLLIIRVIGGRPVVETPAQDAATLPYVNLRVLGSTNLVDWTLPIKPASDTVGKLSGRSWYESEGPPPGKTFFRLESELK